MVVTAHNEIHTVRLVCLGIGDGSNLIAQRDVLFVSFRLCCIKGSPTRWT